MKKQLSLALLTVSIATLNILPAQAVEEVANQSQTSTLSTVSSGEWCVWFPWMGELCWGL